MATNIRNRVPVYPGRVKLIPVAGQENTYDMERADSPTEDGSSVDKALLDEIGIHQMDYAYAENNHALAGLNGAGGLVNAIFIPSQNFSQNDTFTVDGTSYTGKLQSDDELYENFFIAGAVVSCVLDTENHTINFKSSGGSVKYASGTITIADYTDSLTIEGFDFLPTHFQLVDDAGYSHNDDNGHRISGILTQGEMVWMVWLGTSDGSDTYFSKLSTDSTEIQNKYSISNGKLMFYDLRSQFVPGQTLTWEVWRVEQ